MIAVPKKLIRRMHGLMFKMPLMITCEAFESFILAYLDDELHERQKFVFEMHLKICRECREYLDAYQASLALAQSALGKNQSEPPGDVPDDLIRAILDARQA